jgi:muramoyltetrapeptide carboxypeptidase LdcA involved in peptidoglycan recycling
MNLQQSNQTDEIHLVTPSGVISLITNDMDLAIARWEKMGQPRGWKILQIVTHRYDVTPARMSRLTKSTAALKLAREQGIPTIDIPLAQAS